MQLQQHVLIVVNGVDCGCVSMKAEGMESEVTAGR